MDWKTALLLLVIGGVTSTWGGVMAPLILEFIRPFIREFLGNMYHQIADPALAPAPAPANRIIDHAPAPANDIMDDFQVNVEQRELPGVPDV